MFCLTMGLFVQAQVGLPPATVGVDYNEGLVFKVKVSLPIHLDLIGALPDGLTLNQNSTITGKPAKSTKGEPVRFAVSLSDASGVVAAQVYSLQVNDAGAAAVKKAEGPSPPDAPCPEKNPVRPRITSRLTEGTTKITGMAEPTKTGCSTRIRAWLVADGNTGILTDRELAVQIAVTGEDPVVSAQGTWSMDIPQALDTGQEIQIEQYFETQQKDDAGKQTTSTTIFGYVSNQMTTDEADRRIIQRTHRKRSQSDTDKGAYFADTDCGATMINWSDAGDGAQKDICKRLIQASAKFLSVPQETQGVADWGRVRATFTSGALISQNQGSFSSASTFLAFVLDKSWRMPDSFVENSGGHGVGVSTFFDTRLTSVPVASCQKAASGSSPGTGPSCEQTLDAFLTSRKTARFSAGAYFPMLTTTWHYQGARNALYWAPLMKVGFDTPVETFDTNATAQTPAAAGPAAAPAIPVNNGRFYNNYSVGTRLGHYRLSSSSDQAPQDISHLDITVGRFSNLESLVHVPGSTDLGHQRLWRFQMEGLLKIPNTPAVIGFSANVGQRTFGGDRLSKPAPDDLRFLFGTKFDVGKLVSKFKGL
ncbi:MAG TPA: Ig domain-containing protein [Candidatus Saccharimonadales bacterium]|nr:Ig domain-containing protein [Candidatus Saccharimonadales bacterium]